ncbi:efflux transporter outer membrane subunit [Aequorivita sp. KMM 9714]|uniref:efflux transporter outer membrane subunit n=1 Tax=Aequorivita sp. KMM 9714 TaxID=2707173 RepID=UPI0013ED200F|nr:efflux transporter outer membrane subunit [Aequorivita sp. KMM 9714]NGX82828.1 efflux transporter outer membrane subunit [Aequorivita sp. KMM 9714]
MKFLKGIAIAMAFLTLQSCFVAKEYSRPESVVESDNFRTENLPQDSLSMATVSWKEIFTDPILQGYIEEGLNNNMDIRIALQQIAIAEAYVKQGKAGYFPTLNGTARVVHQELSESSRFPGQSSSVDQFEVSGGLSWEADIWGKIRSTKRASDATYLQTVAAHQAVKSRLVANIAATYYQLLAIDEQIRVTEETISARTEGVETTIALKDAGIGNEAGVKQTEAQLYTAQAILVDLKNQSRLVENTLSILLGSSPQQITRGTLDNQSIEIPLETGVPSQLLSNRPDVIAAEYGLVNAFELTNVARSSFYPSLTLSANGGFQSLDLDKLFNVNSLFASVVGGLTQPIFNGRKIKTQYEVSQARQEQALLNFKYALLIAGKEVSDAMYSIEAATEKISIKERENEAYNLATEYSEELLDNGMGTYLEVLTAQERALGSSLDLVAAKNNRLQAIVDLYEALGGGWR